MCMTPFGKHCTCTTVATEFSRNWTRFRWDSEQPRGIYFRLMTRNTLRHQWELTSSCQVSITYNSRMCSYRRCTDLFCAKMYGTCTHLFEPFQEICWHQMLTSCWATSRASNVRTPITSSPNLAPRCTRPCKYLSTSCGCMLAFDFCECLSIVWAHLILCMC